MKIRQLLAAVVAVSATVAQADVISTGVLAAAGDGSVGTNEADGQGDGRGAVPVAIILPGDVHNALQKSVGLSATCVGDRTKACMPSMSSAEVRSILNGSLIAGAFVSGTGGTLASNLGDATNYSGTANTTPAFRRIYASAVSDALTQFVGSGFIAGKSCGSGAALAAANTATADDAATLAAVSSGNGDAFMDIGFIHATEVDASNTDYGMVKLDGAAPDLVNLLSANYNLISNVHDSAELSYAATEVAAHGTTFGAADAGGSGPASLAVPFHNFVNIFTACAPIDTGAKMNDVNGGGL